MVGIRKRIRELIICYFIFQLLACGSDVLYENYENFVIHGELEIEGVSSVKDAFSQSYEAMLQCEYFRDNYPINYEFFETVLNDLTVEVLSFEKEMVEVGECGNAEVISRHIQLNSDRTWDNGPDSCWWQVTITHELMHMARFFHGLEQDAEIFFEVLDQCVGFWPDFNF